MQFKTLTAFVLLSLTFFTSAAPVNSSGDGGSSNRTDGLGPQKIHAAREYRPHDYSPRSSGDQKHDHGTLNGRDIAAGGREKNEAINHSRRSGVRKVSEHDARGEPNPEPKRPHRRSIPDIHDSPSHHERSILPDDSKPNVHDSSNGKRSDEQDRKGNATPHRRSTDTPEPGVNESSAHHKRNVPNDSNSHDHTSSGHKRRSLPDNSKPDSRHHQRSVPSNSKPQSHPHGQRSVPDNSKPPYHDLSAGKRTDQRGGNGDGKPHRRATEISEPEVHSHHQRNVPDHSQPDVHHSSAGKRSDDQDHKGDGKQHRRSTEAFEPGAHPHQQRTVPDNSNAHDHPSPVHNRRSIPDNSNAHDHDSSTVKRSNEQDRKDNAKPHRRSTETPEDHTHHKRSVPGNSKPERLAHNRRSTPNNSKPHDHDLTAKRSDEQDRKGDGKQHTRSTEASEPEVHAHHQRNAPDNSKPQGHSSPVHNKRGIPDQSKPHGTNKRSAGNGDHDPKDIDL